MGSFAGGITIITVSHLSENWIIKLLNIVIIIELMLYSCEQFIPSLYIFIRIFEFFWVILYYNEEKLKKKNFVNQYLQSQRVEEWKIFI